MHRFATAISKSEIRNKLKIRNPKQAQNPKSETSSKSEIRNMVFFLWILDLFRISIFGFRIFDSAALGEKQSHHIDVQHEEHQAKDHPQADIGGDDAHPLGGGLATDFLVDQKHHVAAVQDRDR